jgi:HAD superfamily hydrolase (TIGR01549 family)
MSFDAIAFDIDGTLYPNIRFYVRVAPFALRHLRMMIALGKTRKELRRLRPGPEAFYGEQARLLAREAGVSAEEAVRFMETRIYRGWEPIFSRVRTYKGLRETLLEFRSRGLKLGVLSDFPAEDKLERLGLGDCWDVVVCSERIGYLKPAREPFDALAGMLGCPAGRILYVGNNRSYDVGGARAAGFRTAIVSPWTKTDGADFAFRDYAKLRNYVLNEL